MKRGLLILGLFFYTILLSAQEGLAKDAFSAGKATVETQTITPSDNEASKNLKENTPTEELDPAAEELLKRQKFIQEKFEQLQKPEAKMLNQTEKLDSEAMLKQLIAASNPEISKEQLKKMKLSDAVNLALVPIKKMSSQEIKSMVLEQTRETKYYNFLVHYPKILEIVIGLIHDDKAIPQMVKVIEDKERLKKFAAVMLCTILFGFVVARVISTKEKKLFRIFAFFVFRIIFMFTLRMGIIYYFYSDELGPAFNVVTNVMLS